jgi:hypothetical protein
MNRSHAALAVALSTSLAVASTAVLHADVRSDQKVKFQLAGALGKVVNFFGGKAARDGVTTTVAVKGDRKLTMSESTGQIIDLSEEKIYDLDVKKKQYTVITFAELRRQMEEARKRAEEEARKADASDKTDKDAAKPDPNAKQYDVDFEVKNTGEKKDVNGFSTSQSIMTITVREKGKTLQQSGGMVLTSDLWLTPSIPAMKEVTDFDMKYAEKLFGPMMNGASPQDMAQAVAMYPAMKPAIEKMATEGRKMQGTPVLTVTTIDAVKSAEQMASEQKAGTDSSSSSGDSAPTSVGGLLGGFGKRMAQRKSNDTAASAPKDRATVVTTTTEVLKVATAVSPEEVAVPQGYKEVKGK